jgi:hypothetical protein
VVSAAHAVEAAVVAAPAAAVVVVIVVVRARLGAVAGDAAVQETAAAAGGTSSHPGEHDQADEDQEHYDDNDHGFIVTLADKYASAAVAAMASVRRWPERRPEDRCPQPPIPTRPATSAGGLVKHRVKFRVGSDLPDLLWAVARGSYLGSPPQRFLM